MTFTADEKARGLDVNHIPAEPGAAAHSDVLVGTGLDDGGDYVLVYPPEGRTAETAKALNDAAAGEEQVVQWLDGAFRVPARVAEAAKLGAESTKVDVPASGGSSSPTVRQSGFGNVTPGPDGNSPAVVTDPPTPGTTPPPAGDPAGDPVGGTVPASSAPAKTAAKPAAGNRAKAPGKSGPGSKETGAANPAGSAE